MAETAKDASKHAAPDAPERIDHRRRCTRLDHRTCCRGSRGSASRRHTLRKRVEMCHAGSRRRPILTPRRHHYSETVHQGFFAELLSIRPRSGSNPRPRCLNNVILDSSVRDSTNLLIAGSEQWTCARAPLIHSAPMPFRAFNLGDNLLKAVEEAGYTEPTPIQVEAIPKIMAGHDLIGIAQTGTGKTAAFVLPILSQLFKAGGSSQTRGIRWLIVAPTRELVVQIEENARVYAKYLPARIAAVFGGVSERPGIESASLRCPSCHCNTWAAPGFGRARVWRFLGTPVPGPGRGGSDAGHGFYSPDSTHHEDPSIKAADAIIFSDAFQRDRDARARVSP